LPFDGPLQSATIARSNNNAFKGFTACLFGGSGCFSGNGEETPRHSRFLQRSEVQAASRRVAGIHFEFSQSQFCLELVTYETVFGCGSTNSFESIVRFHDRVGNAWECLPVRASIVEQSPLPY
jgi:hypothetical protein